MTTESGHGDLARKGDFRELKPVELWGGNIALGKEDPDKEALKSAIKTSVQERKQNCFGYFVYGAEDRTYYHMSRYPRRKYGPMPDEGALRGLMQDISSKLGAEAAEEQNTGEPTFRIVLGLEEGYGTSKFHTLEEVRAILGDGFKLTSAEIFTARPGDKEPTTYQEIAVMIEGDVVDVEKVYRLAEQFKQERFAVENKQTRSAKIVETKVCSSPDEE